jgi:hypothetical protein
MFGLWNDCACLHKVCGRIPATTVILFCVKVPVLSEQTLVALAIISQAFSWRTKLWSFNMRVVANARERE